MPCSLDCTCCIGSRCDNFPLNDPSYNRHECPSSFAVGTCNEPFRGQLANSKGTNGEWAPMLRPEGGGGGHGSKHPRANEYFQFLLTFHFKVVLDLLESCSSRQIAQAYSTPRFQL